MIGIDNDRCGCAPWKGGAFQWVRDPPGNRSSREQKTRLLQLAAPVEGVVQQLAIHTVGGVVTPAQSLLVVVPNDSRLEIEATVSNRDIGFVQPGQG